jgi:phenylalanyl-tRNA synthetase alpha chain
MSETKSSSKDNAIQAILDELSTNTTIPDSRSFASKLNVDHDIIIGAIKSLAAEGYTLDPKVIKVQNYELTKEARLCLTAGSPEIRFYNNVSADGGTSEQDLIPVFNNNKGDFMNGKKNCMAKRWVGFTKDDGLYRRLVSSADVSDVLVAQLKHVDSCSGDIGCFDDINVWKQKKKGENWKILKKRKMVELKTTTSFTVAKGPNFQSKFVKAVADLTKDMVDSNAWKRTTFKKYNFKSLGSNVGGGTLHPLMKVRTEFRKILLQMGFEEMPTNRYVESSFWNFDSLFQPQQHPARDAHDTFFLEQPAAALKIPEDYMKIVKNTHENGGGFGSIGYRYDWSEKEARKNVLRTHTTAISSQMLYKLGQDCKSGKAFTPKKYFSIVRNEMKIC